MNEIEEIKDKIKETRDKPKRNLGKRGKIAIIGVVGIIAILIGAVLYVTLTAPQEKYWKPSGKFQMPEVDWSKVNDTYILDRTYYKGAPFINHTIGSKKSDNLFRIAIITNLSLYLYSPREFDELRGFFYVGFEKISGDYIVKELVLKYNFSDDNLKMLPLGNDFTGKNLYFTGERGHYGLYDNKFEYEWLELHELVGINVENKEIKSGGFSDIFLIDLYHTSPTWTNHTITFTAILYYGHPSLLGWQDVHELSTSLVIYVVSEGGE